MTERLTKRMNKSVQDKYSLGSVLYYDFNGLDNTNALLNKLGKLEDIMEKYGIESVEDLNFRLAFKQNDIANYKYISQLEQDKDTCVKAFDMLSETFFTEEINEQYYMDVLEEWKHSNGIDMYGIDSELLKQYFYQQAQKEGKTDD